MQMCASAVQIFFEYPHHGVGGALVQCQISHKYHPTRRICCQLLERTWCHHLSTFGLQWPQWPKMDRKRLFLPVRIFDVQTKKKTPGNWQIRSDHKNGRDRQEVSGRNKKLFFSIFYCTNSIKFQFFIARTESKLTYSRNN